MVELLVSEWVRYSLISVYKKLLYFTLFTLLTVILHYTALCPHLGTSQVHLHDCYIITEKSILYSAIMIKWSDSLCQSLAYLSQDTTLHLMTSCVQTHRVYGCYVVVAAGLIKVLMTDRLRSVIHSFFSVGMCVWVGT